MSYREIRNFCEMMKSLGYPRVISMENFRIPNFKLVAEIIFWLVKRFDPKADIPDDIEDEKARVEFIKAACGFFHQNLKLTLNPKKIYSSDGHCVQELLKVTEILYNAKKSVSFGNDYDCGKELDITSRRNDIDNMKILSNEIVELGINVTIIINNTYSFWIY